MRLRLGGRSDRLRLGGRSDKKENRHSVLDTESPALGWDWAPSPDWGRMGWGVSRKGGCFCRHSEQRSMIQNPLQPLPKRHTGWIFGRAMRERMRTKPVRWRKTMSFPPARIIQIRTGIPRKSESC